MPKLYLSSGQAGYVPATIRGGWERTTDHLARAMFISPDAAELGAPQSVTSAESSASANFDVLLLRGVSAPLAANWTFSGTLNLMLAAAESLNDADFAYYLHVFVTQGDSDTVRGTLLANYADPSTNEWAQTTATGKALSATQSLSSVAALTGDRIVAEIGYRAYNTITGSRTGTLFYGGNGSDLASGGGSSSGVGFLNFSDAFTLVDNATLRVSQVAVETLYRPSNAALRISQLAVEALIHPVPALRVSQAAIEVLRTNGTVISASQQGGMIVVAT
jgi:hypothetical protein